MYVAESCKVIEKLIPKILGGLGKENPSKKRCEVAFVQHKCPVTSVSVRVLTFSVHYVQLVKEKVVYACRACRECRPVCVHIPELFVRVSMAVQNSTKSGVMSHNSSTGLLGTFQACERNTKKLFRSSSIILATLIYLFFPL